MPDPALEPGGPNLREAATLQGGDKVGHKNPPNREPTIPLAAVAPWNPAQTLERLGGDEKLLHEVMEIFREEAPKHLAGLREAISQQDAGTTERLAHTLHGELGYLGIPELLHGARELEEKGRTSDFQGASSLFPPFEAAMARLLASMGDAQKRGSENQLTPGPSGVSP
jgi:HPt (histidine-containing phosphotransfer) domain-containing protein